MCSVLFHIKRLLLLLAFPTPSLLYILWVIKYCWVAETELSGSQPLMSRKTGYSFEQVS